MMPIQRKSLRELRRKVTEVDIASGSNKVHGFRSRKLRIGRSTFLAVFGVMAFVASIQSLRNIMKYLMNYDHGQDVDHYQSIEEAEYRSKRFPSVHTRVKVYMSNWYSPPCDSNAKLHARYVMNQHNGSYYDTKEIPDNHGNSRTFRIPQEVRVDHISYLHNDEYIMCTNRSWGIRFYCSDLQRSFEQAVDSLNWNNDVPVLAQFGDHGEAVAFGVDGTELRNPRLPHLKKFRHALTMREIINVTSPECYGGEGGNTRHAPSSIRDGELQPILWKLNVGRHFGSLGLVRRLDIAWDLKLDAAVFRGMLTGSGYEETLSDFDNCNRLPRCRLVYTTSRSSLIDAKVTGTHGRISGLVDGVNVTSRQYRKEELLAFKGIIVIEGNDVSSGLKWALYSNSVVLMAPPTRTSWAMEELLEPWVHYIPLKPDLGDIEQKVEWMVNHDHEAQRIAHRATLWMKDLAYHPDALIDELWINREIMRRYQAHFLVDKYSLI